jgi:integrase
MPRKHLVVYPKQLARADNPHISNPRVLCRLQTLAMSAQLPNVYRRNQMRSRDFLVFKAEVLSLNEPPIRAKGTYRQMSQVLREFAKLPTVRKASDINAANIAAWIRAFPRRTPVRTASLLRSLSSACSYAMTTGDLRANPFAWRRVNRWVRDQVLAPDRPRPLRHQSAEATMRLLEYVDGVAALGSWKAGRLQALVYMLAYTGLRKAEALSLRPWDVDLDRCVVSIQPRATFRPKTKKSAARLPLAEPLVRVLRLWITRCGGNWLFPGVRLKAPWLGGPPGYKPLDEIRAAGEAVGIVGLTIASFRKTIGTLAKTWGLGQLELKALLRHSNVETQRWYDEEQVESLRPAVAKIQFCVVVPGA